MDFSLCFIYFFIHFFFLFYFLFICFMANLLLVCIESQDVFPDLLSCFPQHFFFNNFFISVFAYFLIFFLWIWVVQISVIRIGNEWINLIICKCCWVLFLYNILKPLHIILTFHPFSFALFLVFVFLVNS